MGDPNIWRRYRDGRRGTEGPPL